MDETTFKQFLADVMTAAGLVAHGKRCKALSERLASRATELYAAPMPPIVPDWRPIETAPKGYPALNEPSEWFLAYGDKYTGPNGGKIAVIRRCFGHGFGPWECTGDAYYKADFYSHWMPLPAAPKPEK